MRASAAWPLASCASASVEEEVVDDGGATDTGERREGGKGMARARLNAEMQRWSWARTWRRVRRRGREGGSSGEVGWEVGGVSGEVGFLPSSSSSLCCSFSSGGESILSRPLGTK